MGAGGFSSGGFSLLVIAEVLGSKSYYISTYEFSVYALSTNILLAKQISWETPTSKDLVWGNAKEVDTEKGQILGKIRQCYTITNCFPVKKK